MSFRLRRRVLACLAATVLALSVETILLQAVSRESQFELAAAWVSTQAPEELAEMSAQVRYYPVVYRKALMRRLSPEQRAQVWRAHIAQYRDSHPELSADALLLLDTVMEAATPEMFSEPGPAERATAEILGEQARAILGAEQADYLLARLGPRDGTFASIEPLRHKVIGRVRSWVVALAAETPACDCATSFGCDGWTTVCRDSVSCTADEEWPMCGWFWNSVCNGACTLYSYN